MININIIYDGVYDDVDIIAVSDEIIDKLDDVVDTFISWTPPENDADHWGFVNQIKCRIIETENFLKWLNERYCKNLPNAYIVKQHTTHCIEYANIEF